MFLFFRKISRTRLYNLVKHLCTNGVVSRTHGNKGKLPKHSMKFCETKYAEATCPQPESNQSAPEIDSPLAAKRATLCM